MDKVLVDYDADISGFKKQIDTLESELLKVESSAKKSSGAINESFTKTSKSASVLQNDLKKVATNLQAATQTEAVTQFGEKTAASFGKITQSANQLPGALGNAANGVTNLLQSFKALLSNPIVLLISGITAALYGLFKAFTSTDSGANKFNAILGEMSAVVDVIRQRAISLTDAIGNIFKGEFTQAAKDFGKAVSLNVSDFEDATKAANKYVYALDSLEDSENNYISNRAENANKIAKLEFLASDRSKSITERREALKEAIRLGEEESKQNIKFAQERLEIEAAKLAGLSGVTKQEIIRFLTLSDAEQESAKQSLKTVRNNNEEKFKVLEELYARTIQADTQFFEENKRNNSKLSTLNETFAKEELDKLIQNIKDKNEARKGERIAPLKAIVGGKSQSEIDAEKELQVKTNLNENLNQLEKEKVEQEKTDQKFRIQQNKEALEERLANERIFAERSIEISQQTAQALSSLSDVITNNELKNLKEQLDKKKITQEQYDQQVKKIEREKAERDKRIAIFNAIINTAAAVTKALPDVILAAAAGIAGAIQIAAIQSEPIPKFAKGTKFLQRGNNKVGIDTIPAMLNEGEAVIPTDINRKHKDIVGAMFDGNLNDLIDRKYIAPALRQYKEAHESKSNSNFADRIAASLAIQNKFTDKEINKRLDKVARVSQENTHHLSKVLRRNTNPRLP